MTKAEFISYIKNLLPGIDKTAKYHDNVVALAIDAAMEQLFHDMYFEDRKTLDAYVKRYTGITATADAAEDDIMDAPLYATLPAAVVNLPSKARGVYRVFDVDDSSLRFVPVSWMEADNLSGSEVQYVTDTIWFTVEPTRLVLHNFADYEGDSLTVYMIPRFYDLSSTDEFNMPFGQDAKVIELVINNLGLIKPKDLLTNNADSNG